MRILTGISRRLCYGIQQNLRISLQVGLIVAMLAALSYWYRLIPWVGDRVLAYLLGAVALAVMGCLFVAALPRDHPVSTEAGQGRRWVGAAVLLLGLGLAGFGCYRWMRFFFTVPIDPLLTADMLVELRLAVRTFLNGENPYRLYYVPWELPLTDGPLLWMPYILPYALGLDLRFLTLLGGLFAPLVCMCGAAALSCRGWRGPAAVTGVLGAALLLSPVIYNFMYIGQTQVYWPLLFLFCFLVACGRHRLGSLVLGLLLASRLTMLALVPVYFAFVLKERRRELPQLLAIFVAAAVLPFVPFLLLDFRSLIDGVYFSYYRLAEQTVWQRPDWIESTFGLTAFLLRKGWQAVLSPLQVGLVGCVSVATFLWVRSRPQLLGAMALALQLFSFAVIWPVFYIHLDVTLLFACAFLLQPGVLLGWLGGRGMFRRWLAIAVGLLVIPAVTCLFVAENFYRLDIGVLHTRTLLSRGFGADVAEAPSGRTFCEIGGKDAQVSLPRRSRNNARVVLTARSPGPSDRPPPQVRVYLNDTPLGEAAVPSDWVDLSFSAPGDHWLMGANSLRIEQLPLTGEATGGQGAGPVTIAVDGISVAR